MLASNAAVAAVTSIEGSYHNLGANNTVGHNANNTGAANMSSATGEVCVFCHTPHGGDNSASAPLWNRVLSNGATTYTRYSALGTSSFDASEAPVGSVTIACLSCHDGTQALDSVINAPGSGQYNPAGARIGGGAMTGGDIDTATGALAAGIVQNLGTDLSNDHPVSMQYGGGGITAAAPAGSTVDPDFVAPLNRAHPRGFTLEVMNAPVRVGGITKLWWIERYADSLVDGQRDRSDIQLYTRLPTDSGLADEQPFVECGSCHDPHNIDNPTFLRVSNGIPGGNTNPDFPNAIDANRGSGLCLTCHTK